MKYDALLDSVLHKNDMLFSGDNALDGKATSMVGFNFAVLLGYGALASETDMVIEPLACLGVYFLTISILVSFAMLFPKSYETVGVSLKKHPEYLQKTEEELCLKVISNAEKAFEINNETLGDKSFVFKGSVVLMFLGNTCLLTSLFK